MNEAAQIVIAASVTILTIVLSLVGVQIIFLLRDLRKTLAKIDSILENTQNFSSRLSHSLDSFGATISGFKTALSILGFFKKEKEKKENE